MNFCFDLDKKEYIRIAVIGVGQVGSRVCQLFGRAGYTVFALDIDEEKIRKLNKRISPIKEDSLDKEIPELIESGKFIPSSNIGEKIKESDIIIVCVPTPLNDGQVDLRPLSSTAEIIGKNLKRGVLVIIESTTYPGVIDDVVKPILEKSGLKTGVDFGIVHCPERVDPGNKKITIFNISRIIGASDIESLIVGKKLYESVLDAEVYPVSNIRTVEMTKIVENTFRDLNIAFVNELAKLVDGTDINIMEVIEAASTKPFSFLKHYPGPGVGGGCIPINPIWLLEFAAKNKKDLKLVRMAREINKSMPCFVVEKLFQRMSKLNKKPEESSVLVLGLTYKANVKDITLSPSKDIISELKKRNFKVFGYDPLLNEKEIESKFNVRNKNIDELENFDAVILAVYHKEFADLLSRLKKINKKIIFFDTRNLLKDAKNNTFYLGMGT